MAKLILAAILVLSLASLVHMQAYGQQNGLLGNLPNQLPILNGLFQNGQSMNTPGMNNNFLGRIGDTIREIPARGMQMLNNVVDGVRNIIPGLGRNGYNANNLQGYGQNMNNPLGNMQGQLSNGLPNQLTNGLNSLTEPINNALQGTGLNPSRLTQGLTNTLSGLTNNQNIPNNPLQG